MWLAFAFTGPVLWAISIHIDKYLVGRFFEKFTVALLLIFTAATGLLLLPAIFALRPAAIRIPFGNMAVIACSGVLYMIGVYLYLRALQSTTASAVAPFFQAAPLFGYVLAYFVLGERLSSMQMSGGALIIGGGALLSLVIGDRRRIELRIVLLMLACALALAVASLIFKIFAFREEFWTATFWSFAGQAMFGAVLLAVREYRAQLLALVRSDPIAIITITGANELINVTGTIAVRYALLFAPLSLVQAVGSTTALFVFVFGCVLSAIRPDLADEDLSRRNLLQKGSATVLIVAGATLINL